MTMTGSAHRERAPSRVPRGTSESFRINIGNIPTVSKHFRGDQGGGGGWRITTGSPAMRAIFASRCRRICVAAGRSCKRWAAMCPMGVERIAAHDGEQRAGRAVPAGCASVHHDAEWPTPRLFIASTLMLGMPGVLLLQLRCRTQLTRTGRAVLKCRLRTRSATCLPGIHGEPVEDRPGAPPVRVFRDQQGQLRPSPRPDRHRNADGLSTGQPAG